MTSANPWRDAWYAIRLGSAWWLLEWAIRVMPASDRKLRLARAIAVGIDIQTDRSA